MGSKLRVTIGIPTRNRLDYLTAALQSALAQPRVFEILVLDDGSEDGTEEYLKLHSATYPKLRYLRFPEQRGRPAARNAVSSSMQGDALMWLDDDDCLTPEALDDQLRVLEENSDIGIVYCDHISCDENLTPNHVCQGRSVPHGQMLMNLVFECVVPNGGTIIRKSVFEKIGGYNPDFPRGQDYEFWARAAVSGIRFYRNPKPLYLFRNHSENLANPSINRHQSLYHTRILQMIVREAPLEEIFPILDWRANPRESAATGMTLLAKVFFDHADDDSALECAILSEGFSPNARARAIKGLALRSMGRIDDALEVLAPLALQPFSDLESCLTPIGAPRGSYKVAQEYDLENSQVNS